MKNVSQNLLSEIKFLLSHLKDEDYSKSLSVLNDNSIGKHVRHILDLFECLIDSAESGILNYDRRERNPQTENDKEFALEKIRNIISNIEILDIDKKIVLRQNLNNSFCEINSSVERELLYNIEHCMHHLAIIRIGIENNFSYAEIPENFGIAYSTISHREQKTG